MKPYSMDLRAKVLGAYDRGEASQRVLAARFSLALSTVQSWVRRRRETGSALPRAAPGACPKLNTDDQTVLLAIIAEAPDGTLDEWATALDARVGARLHRSTVGRYARRLGLTRKQRRPKPRSASAAT